MLDFRIQYALHTTSFEEQPLADFEFNEEGTKVLRCPAGHSPKSCSYMKQSNQCAVSFLHEQCVVSVEFPKTLQLCEGSGKLCPKSGTCIKQGRGYPAYIPKSPAIYYKI